MRFNRISKLVHFLIGILLIALFCGVCVTNYSTAKFTGENATSYTANLQDFDVSFTLKYTSGGVQNTFTPGSIADTGVLRLTADEYATLKMDIAYTGEGACYCRFRVTESWQHTDTETGKDIITPKQLSSYALYDNLYDNRSDDGYIYCTELLKGTSRNFTAISDCTAGADAGDLLSPADAAQFVDIAVELDAVQWNKAEDQWGLEKMPWE